MPDLVAAVRSAPGLLGKRDLKLVRQFAPDGDDAALIARADGFLVICGEAMSPPFVKADPFGAGAAAVVTAEGAPRVEFRVRGADTVGATVYGLDARESDLTPATPALVAAALGPTVQVLSDAAFADERFAGTRRADASAMLLALALLLAATELGVATLTR